MDFKWYFYQSKYIYISCKRFVSDMVLKKDYHPRNTKYAGRELMKCEETNAFIAERINGGNPFMICRFGATEMNVINAFLKVTHFPFVDQRKQRMEKLCETAGFFPNDISQGERFVELMLKCCQSIDLCATWNLTMEDYILDRYAPEAKITTLGSLEPWITRPVKPWSSALKGKRVLVVHPFDESINKQYRNCREKIFERIYNSDDILPEFELITVKAVQSICCNNDGTYKDWFDALNSMIEQCKQIDFDVAIVGCGAYGFPLAEEIKRMGKGAIHLGGATQLLFGIMGRRWETGDYKYQLDQVINEWWTRPMESERPQNFDKVEGGCYW